MPMMLPTSLPLKKVKLRLVVSTLFYTSTFSEWEEDLYMTAQVVLSLSF